MLQFDADVVVIGGGVVGLAVARRLALGGAAVIVLEKNARPGEEASARNSEVIHAGIYYPSGSWKARLCVPGSRELYDYCTARGIEARRVGKLIVATHEREVATLEKYLATGTANGTEGLAIIDAATAARLEPEVKAVAALWSPATGILDSHAYLTSLLGDLESHGGSLATHAEVERVTAAGDAHAVHVRQGGDAYTVLARCVVNAAGLHAPDVARRIERLDAERLPRAYYARGRYYALRGRSPFTHLVYPIAEAAGLGVHATLDLAGRTRFGPDVQWIDSIDYRFEDEARPQFAAAIARYWPAATPDRLEPAYTGIRAKISGPGEPARDFLIEGPDMHGVPGLVNLLGIESPGLTSSLAIAHQVRSLLADAVA
jgi:L-2-hydroxyglutarate oxidase LhgO